MLILLLFKCVIGNSFISQILIALGQANYKSTLDALVFILVIYKSLFPFTSTKVKTKTCSKITIFYRLTNW